MNPDEIKNLIREVVTETLREVASQTIPRIAYSEPEAAAALGLRPYQLRDERLRGLITFSRGPKNRILYSRDDLEKYLASRRDMKVVRLRA